VLITHDHWDHLDYDSILSLKQSGAVFICGLGVGAHLEYWGVPVGRIIELDWRESVPLGSSGVTLHCLPTHHFSGRTLKRDSTLWAAYVLESPSRRVYIGGDGGYGPHFAEAGRRFAPFALAVLECGQYDAAWPYTHMRPEETLRAAVELKTGSLLPVHNSKFELAHHSWDAPLRSLSALPVPAGLRLLTPRIGEAVDLNDPDQPFSRWWEGIDGNLSEGRGFKP
jgi:L-ascorbate metabolism protein UlaG (beta-lactamase superfamily)